MAFLSEAMLRRVAKHLGLGVRTPVLMLGFGESIAPAVLAKETGANLVAADADPEVVQKHRNTLREHGVDDRVRVRQVDYARLPFSDSEFEAILVWAPAMSLDAIAHQSRRHLVIDGRLCVAHPVRVGRHPNPAVARVWEQKTGAPLQLPSQCLQALEREGYEPQTAEVFDEAAMDAYYRHLEQSQGDDDAKLAVLREEVALFRSQGGRFGASFAVMVARRREPGEKPPPVGHQ